VSRLILACAILILPQLGCESQPPAPQGAAPSAATAPAPAASASAAEAPRAPRTAVVREGSVIARSPEGDALFVADEDHASLRVLPLPVQLHGDRVDVPMPGRPAQLVATGDRVLVTVRVLDDKGANAGEGALLVFRRKPGFALEEVGRVPLPADAWGLAITPDERTAIVSSAWTHHLSAVDVEAMKVLWSVDVAREPRGVTVLPGGDRAYVSHIVGGSVTRVDGLTAKEPRVQRVALPAAPLRSPIGVTLPASVGYAALASPSGDRVYFPREALGALGPNPWLGAGAVDVLDPATDTNLAPPRAVPAARFAAVVSSRFENERWISGNDVVIERPSPIVEPSAVVYRRRTDTILVANRGSDEVVELDALAMDPTVGAVRRHRVGRNYDRTLEVPKQGSAPMGIALSAQEDEAYVFCRGTYDVVVLKLPVDRGAYRVAPPVAIPVAGDDDRLATGRRLFYKADSGYMSGGLSCAGCHPEGRDDGFVWREVTFTPQTGKFTNFFAGTDLSSVKVHWPDVPFEGTGGFGYARQTPMLVGRVAAMGPYGWHAESTSLAARLLAGFDLHRWREGADNMTVKRALANALVPFLREGLVPPPRPDRPLTAEEQRGKTIFESPEAACATCHVPSSAYTDRVAVSLRKLRPPAGFAEDPNPNYKTPSLLFVGGSPPYLHDGRFESLESLVELNQDRMGKTSHLSADDRKALVAFLRTL
jgi:DNA-binding beta-propeller fold protein YncE/mono/diheme cytochrome c family protein